MLVRYSKGPNISWPEFGTRIFSLLMRWSWLSSSLLWHCSHPQISDLSRAMDKKPAIYWQSIKRNQCLILKDVSIPGLYLSENDAVECIYSHGVGDHNAPR